MLHISHFSRLLGCALSTCVIGTLATAQVSQVWTERYAPMNWDLAQTLLMKAVPSGGVVTGSTGTSFSIIDGGEAVIRRLTENGDRVFEVTLPLPAADYIGLLFRHYLADISVGPIGQVAVAVGSEGPMRINMYEADGDLRWSTTIDVITGPHFDQADLEIAPGGDVLLHTTERLFFGSSTERFRLYRFAAADGTVLWTEHAPANGIGNLTVDSQGNAILAVNRQSTGPDTWTIERFDPLGDQTGALSFQTRGFNQTRRVTAMETDAAGRTVAAFISFPADFVVSIDSSMSLEWTTQVPSESFRWIALMADGHTIVTDNQRSTRLRRLDRQGDVAYSILPSQTSSFLCRLPAGLPNGNSLVELYEIGSPGVHQIQERDPSGALVRTFQTEALQPGLDALVVDSRGNAHATYFQSTAPNVVDAIHLKLVYEDLQGTPYCGPAVPNSTGFSATARAVGTTGVDGNNLSLLFANLPVGSTVLPITSQTTGLVIQPGGSQGTLCLGGGIGRFVGPGQIRSADAAGTASLQLDLLQIPTPSGVSPVTAGQTWNFQAWYRDANPSVTSNFTDAVAVTLD